MLRLEELTFHDLSFVDSSGRLFFHESEIYRAIFEEKAVLYQRLFDSEIVSKLVKDGVLVHTEIADIEVESCPLVLWHKRVPFVSYPHEWCNQMFKDAALAFLDLNLALRQYDLSCVDPRNLNILFDGCQPIYVDFCAIEETISRQDFDTLRARFMANFLYPLKVMGEGYGELAKIWVKERYFFVKRVLQNESLAFQARPSIRSLATYYYLQYILVVRQKCPRSALKLVKWVQSRLVDSKKKLGRSQSDIDLGFVNLREEVLRINVSCKKQTQLSTPRKVSQTQINSHAYEQKITKVNEIIQSLQVKTVLYTDIGDGSCIRQTAIDGQKVVALDEIEANVQKLYSIAKEQRLDILPLSIDWTAPNFGLSNDAFESVQNRLSCDLVVSVDFIRHWILKQHTFLTLDKALKRLHSLSNRWLIIEYLTYPELEDFLSIQNANWKARRWWIQSDWYSLKEFCLLLNPYFCLEKVVELNSSGRSLLLFSKL